MCASCAGSTVKTFANNASMQVTFINRERRNAFLRGVLRFSSSSTKIRPAYLRT